MSVRCGDAAAPAWLFGVWHDRCAVSAVQLMGVHHRTGGVARLAGLRAQHPRKHRKFRRKLRLRQLTDEILNLQVEDAMSLTVGLRVKLQALKRNIPVYAWSRFTSKGRTKLDIHRFIDTLDLAALREAINDLLSYSEDV